MADEASGSKEKKDFMPKLVSYVESFLSNLQYVWGNRTAWLIIFGGIVVLTMLNLSIDWMLGKDFFDELAKFFYQKVYSYVSSSPPPNLLQNLTMVILSFFLLLAPSRTENREADTSVTEPVDPNKHIEWLNQRWGDGSYGIKIFTTEATWATEQVPESLRKLNGKTEIYLKSKHDLKPGHQLLSSKDMKIEEWGTWPLDRLLNKWTSEAHESFSVVQKGRDRFSDTYVLFANRRDADTKTPRYEQFTYNVSRNATDTHPGARIASQYFDLISELHENVTKPLTNILGVYIDFVYRSNPGSASFNLKRDLKNTALVRFQQESSSGGKIVFEGIGFEPDRDSRTRSFEVQYWRSEPICIELFSLSRKPEQHIIFRSSPSDVKIFKAKNLEHVNSGMVLENVGELKRRHGNEDTFEGSFYDLSHPTSCPLVAGRARGRGEGVGGIGPLANQASMTNLGAADDAHLLCAKKLWVRLLPLANHARDGKTSDIEAKMDEIIELARNAIAAEQSGAREANIESKMQNRVQELFTQSDYWRATSMFWERTQSLL